MAPGADVSPFQSFSRQQWRRLRASTPLTLGQADVARLRGLGEQINLDEVADVYLPLSRLLNLYVAAAQDLRGVSHAFLGSLTPRVPFIIGIAGSVAVGKSTTARILQALLSRWPNHPDVDLVTTDGFLYPNAVLEQRGLLRRKGFPESYDLRRLIGFLHDLKSGRPEVAAPVYSHLHYDILPSEQQLVRSPDIVIVEGLNVLQPGRGEVVVSDFFDFSLYVHADEDQIRGWYVDRFLRLRDTAFRDPSSYFRRYADLSADQAVAVATGIWNEINGPNLRENIAPARGRADLILEKGQDHRVQGVKLRKL